MCNATFDSQNVPIMYTTGVHVLNEYGTEKLALFKFALAHLPSLICPSFPPALSVSVVGLERALLQYCSQPNEQPFDIKTVPIETQPLGETLKCT